MASTSAASSSGALRSVMRPRTIHQGLAKRVGSSRGDGVASRSFAAAAQRQPIDHLDQSPSYSHSTYTPPTRSALPEPITPSSAQSYLSNLLHLSPTRQFSPDLSLQILTHKSYRYAHLIRHQNEYRSSRYSPPLNPSLEGPSSVSHNARLSFLGRRAIQTYLALFLHSHLRTDRGLRDVDFLRGKGMDEKLRAMTHVNNLGREVGSQWGVGDVMRWDRNEVGKPGENLKIKGLTVESIIGGLFSEFGSSASQRAFHLHVLPHLSEQLRDPLLLERAEKMRVEVKREFGGGIIAENSS